MDLSESVNLFSHKHKLHNTVSFYDFCQAWKGFEPMTSATPIQCYNNKAGKTTEGWSLS